MTTPQQRIGAGFGARSSAPDPAAPASGSAAALVGGYASRAELAELAEEYLGG
ncbi:hypothetical protein [[Kitasatospora] papulosa]|uniref:hypothetical protein n=1 Tax=[Kitasatospora] papulosa TaxID=1464011 RepID=UPI0037FC3A56